MNADLLHALERCLAIASVNAEEFSESRVLRNHAEDLRNLRSSLIELVEAVDMYVVVHLQDSTDPHCSDECSTRLIESLRPFL